MQSSSTFNVTRMQSVKDHTVFTALRQCWTVPRTLSKWHLVMWKFKTINNIKRTSRRFSKDHFPDFCTCPKVKPPFYFICLLWALSICLESWMSLFVLQVSFHCGLLQTHTFTIIPNRFLVSNHYHLSHTLYPFPTTFLCIPHSFNSETIFLLWNNSLLFLNESMNVAGEFKLNTCAQRCSQEVPVGFEPTIFPLANRYLTTRPPWPSQVDNLQSLHNYFKILPYLNITNCDHGKIA